MKVEVMSKIASCFLVALLLTSTDTLLFGTNADRSFLFVSRIMGVSTAFILPLIAAVDKKNKDRNIGIICFLMMTLMAFSAWYNEDDISSSLSKLISVMAGYFIAKHYSFMDFCKIFENFVYKISLIAIVVEVVAYLLPALILAMPTVENAAGTIHKSFFFGSLQVKALGGTIIRANGIFWEAGALASYVIWCLMVQLFVKGMFNSKRIFVSLITLFITYSTTGFLTFLVLAIAYILNSTKSKSAKKMKRLIGYGIIFLSIYLIFNTDSDLYKIVFSKLHGSGTEMSSTSQTRFSSFFNGINAFLLNPLIGGGGNTADMMDIILNSELAQYESGGNMLTNTVVANFTSWGVFFGSIFLLGSIKFVRLFSNRKNVFIFLVLAFLMTYSGERFYSFIPFVFMFYGYKQNSSYYENTND